MSRQTLHLERRTFLRRAGFATAATLATAVGLGRRWSGSARSAEAAEAVHDFSLRDIVSGAIGPSARYCMGYSNPGATGLGYIAALKLSADVVKTRKKDRELDEGTAGTVPYDICEKKDAYIGQVNMSSSIRHPKSRAVTSMKPDELGSESIEDKLPTAQSIAARVVH
jgi:Histidine carboxylase PI chain